jgi:Tfp pilus assembly protein PilF
MDLLGDLPISVRAGNALVSYVRYLGKLVWPDHLAFFYPYPGVRMVGSEGWTEWQVAGSAMLLALITLAALWQARRRPFLIVGWLWFLGTLVPVIGLVQVGGQAMADRYTYLPLIGVFVMLAWGWKEFDSRRPVAGAAAAGLLAACLAMTGRQLGYWRNSEALCRHAIAVTTHNYKAHFNLGLALIGEGKKDAAIMEMYEAVAIAPGFSGRIELAQALMHQGRIQEAIEQYRAILQYDPHHLLALNNLAWLLATNKDPKLRNGAEAVQLAERACTLTDYQKPFLIGTLAAAYAEAGRFDDAIKAEERTIASATAAGQTNLLQKNQQLLELYRAGHPYHETTKL